MIPAQIIQKKGGYLILVAYKKGQVLRQNMAMHAVDNAKLKSNSQLVTKCLEVDKKGVATLEVTVPAVGTSKESKKRIKVDRHGKPLGQNIDGFSGNFVWPDNPVKIGQEWLGEMNMAGPGQGQAGGIGFKSSYKLVGLKTIKGVKVAAISANINVKGTYEVSGTGMIYVRFSDGQLQSADFKMKLNQFSQSNSQQKLRLVMTIRTLS
jgi:hypothetical protein